MSTFAIISNGTVVNLTLGLPALASGQTSVDVTTASPQPAIGWSYSGSVFSAPAAGTPTKEDTFLAQIAAGYDTGLGWTLPLDDSDRNLITSGATLINCAITALNLQNNSAGVAALLAQSFIFVDITGTAQTVTTQQALSIMVAYGNYYNTIWSAAQ